MASPFTEKIAPLTECLLTQVRFIAHLGAHLKRHGRLERSRKAGVTGIVLGGCLNLRPRPVETTRPFRDVTVADVMPVRCTARTSHQSMAPMRVAWLGAITAETKKDDARSRNLPGGERILARKECDSGWFLTMQNSPDYHETVHYQLDRLKQGGSLQKAVQDDGRIFVIYGQGGGCTLEISGGAAGFWISLHGSVRVNNTNLIQLVGPREALVSEHDSRVRAIGHANSRWLAILGGKKAWAALLIRAAGHDAQLLPELHQISRILRHRALVTLRAASRLELEASIHAIVDEIVSGQSVLRAAIARCPGKTFAKRRQVFLRLQRVRNYICANCEEELDNEVLARMANYSPCHFLRTFNAVFLETPHAYLVERRLDKARRLLMSGELAVTEVALASGFEDRSAFSRLFRKRFGTTAKEAMRSLRAVAE